MLELRVTPSIMPRLSLSGQSYDFAAPDPDRAVARPTVKAY